MKRLYAVFAFMVYCLFDEFHSRVVLPTVAATFLAWGCDYHLRHNIGAWVKGYLVVVDNFACG